MIRSYIEFGCACWFFAGLAWFLFAKSYPGRSYVRSNVDLLDAYMMHTAGDGWWETLDDIQALPETDEVAA